tara:strand:- start:120 stop:563 length:444 start_codon:yes stop_codon:yes gene_type:complete
VNLYKHLIKFLVLLSASLSLQSALAFELSSVLGSNFYAVSKSNNTIKQFDSDITLHAFNDLHFSELTLANNLLLLLKEKHDDHLLFQALLGEIITSDLQRKEQVIDSHDKHCYQTQCNAYLNILAHQNTLYSKKSSYQAKLQQQRAS